MIIMMLINPLSAQDDQDDDALTATQAHLGRNISVSSLKQWEALLVSDISLWEIAMRSSRRRIALRLPLRD